MRLSILFLVACGAPPTSIATPMPTPIAQTPTDAAVVAQEEEAPAPACVAIDPKTTHSQAGAYILVEESSAVVIYRQSAANCAIALARIQVPGSFAFAELIAKPNVDAVPDVSLDTWLMHGDRLRREYVWAGTQYLQGPEKEMPGPGKWRQSHP